MMREMVRVSRRTTYRGESLTTLLTHQQPPVRRQEEVVVRTRQRLPHLIEPGLTVEAARFDDERVAIPSADRLSHPRIHRRGCGTGHVDVANRARVFVRKEDDL